VPGESLGKPVVAVPMAATYDDGRSDVPGGVTGPVERVVVVGAGIAGLTVANALANAGVACVVVEARDRVGGRLHTIDLAGYPVDMGGSWIHHPIGNPLRAFADQVGIGCRDGDPLPEMAAYDFGEGRRLSPAEVRAELSTLYEAFPAAVDRLQRELSPDASAAEGIGAFVDGADLSPAAARRARQGLRALIEGESADLPERQSLRWMWNEFEYEGGFFGDLPSGGYRSLVQAMAAGLDVRLDFDVAEIAVGPDGVNVRSAAGPAENGSHVVVTVPLGVLKDRRPQFSPALPPDRLAAIDRLGFGRFEKVVLTFDHAFWRAAGLPHLMLFPGDPDESAIWMIGLDAFGAGPTLVFFIFHGAAGRMPDTTPDDAADWVRGMLTEAIGATCPEPAAVAMTSWAADPYSLGAYSHIPPGATPADADLLGEPLHGRLLFAGEHTQSARLVYTDGAMASGIREAKRLLQRAHVRLGPGAA
jgi:polyamine oxidase